MSELRLTTSRTDTVDVLEVHGNLTAATALILHSQLELLLQRPDPVIVVDLRNAQQCDSTAIAVLLAAAAAATTTGGALRLARPPGPVCATLRAAQTMRIIPTYGAVSTAITANPIDLLDTPGAPLDPTRRPAVSTLGDTPAVRGASLR
ncbi:STAS domain-containing protein [Dactylosporangium sp. NBC_01737]|uniref:STAS domain-containing protein n=1 Tax=Dactylosporangium sp. NBC_01737 TaxID=2975959 RepID=UPI002E0DE6C1|nr:STAS domain-containing protein [Dactylosporangium sp. NBC_01737]